MAIIVASGHTSMHAYAVLRLRSNQISTDLFGIAFGIRSIYLCLFGKRVRIFAFTKTVCKTLMIYMCAAMRMKCWEMNKKKRKIFATCCIVFLFRCAHG